MRDKLKIRYVVLIVLLSVVWATQLIPILGEVYAQSVYPVISHFLSSFSKLMPFAIGDLCTRTSFQSNQGTLYPKEKVETDSAERNGILAVDICMVLSGMGTELLTERFLWQDKHSLYCLYSRNLSVICRQLYRQAECFLYRCHLH